MKHLIKYEEDYKVYYLDPDKMYYKRVINEEYSIISQIEEDKIKETLREIREIIKYRKLNK